ncbi:MAG: phenylalanine--tRNA ligase subunit beta [Bacillota bacterium]
MRVPLGWLRDYCEWPWDATGLAEQLTMAGVKVEAVGELGAGLRGAVAARVTAVEPHPDPGPGGRLWLVGLDTGAGERSVVAGTANMKTGDLVAYAPPGSVLPGDWEIGSTNLRGVESEGMVLSLSELVLGEHPREGEGVLILAAGDSPGLPGEARPVAPGTDLAGALGLPETVLELDLTPNYATHLQSIIGVAREVAALTGAGPSGVRFSDPVSLLRPGGEPAGVSASVEIEDPELCPRYIARVIRGVAVGPSPWWIQLRLLACGMRPINNIVDITNYVMLEYGQPLHAFDLERLEGRRIVVRRARPDERLVTLDGLERDLTGDMLVIADAARPVALAGVMGGEGSEVGPGTVDILLESACFAPNSVRRTSKALGLVSEASTRFDKGPDPEAVDPASARAAGLIAAVAGGTVAPGSVDHSPRPFAPRRLRLRSQRVSALLGVDLRPALIAAYLGRFGFGCRPAAGTDGVLEVTIPSWRGDVSGEADLIEEVARLHGYGEIPPTLPRGETTVGTRPKLARLADRVRRTLVGLGYTEVVTSSLVDPERERLLGPGPDPLELANPLAENRRGLRTGLLGNLVEVVARNLSYGERRLRLFEVGTANWPPAKGPLSPAALPVEKRYLAVVATGRGEEGSWLPPTAEPDFFHMKGIASVVLWELGVAGWTLRRSPAGDRRLHPGRQALLVAEGPNGGPVELGVLGELHPRVARECDVDARVSVLELDLDQVARAPGAVVRVEPLPRFPAVLRDVAVVLPREVEAGRIEEVIRRSAGALCAGVRLFDVYHGHPVPEGQRSTAWRIVYRSVERSLTDAEVDEVHGRVRQALMDELGAVLR